MNRNPGEGVLRLHRTFLPRSRSGLSFLIGTVFLNAALLFGAFVLATSHGVLKPGIALELPIASQTEGLRFNDRVLSLSREGFLFFNDERVTLTELESVLHAAVQGHSDPALILEADAATPQATLTAVYDAAASAGFRKIFIATRSAPPATSVRPAP